MAKYRKKSNAKKRQQNQQLEHEFIADESNFPDMQIKTFMDAEAQRVEFVLLFFMAQHPHQSV